MFYYIKVRKKGDLIWRTLRKDGKILFFDRYENAKKYGSGLTDFFYKIVSNPYHPANKKSPLYRKKYRRVEQ